MLALKDITNAVLAYHPKADIDVILDAYLFSAKAHRGQSRDSGEAYFSHPVHVAYNLTKLRMDENAIAAGLLHDTIEDTLATPEEIRSMFGDEVYQLVEGVTKIGQVEFASQEEKQAENYRKMILAMSEDIRVVYIKLADRAHNLETLGSLSDSRKKRIARETLDIYAPLANRLGIGWLKADLENNSFKYLAPKEYEEIGNQVRQGEDQRNKYVEEVCQVLMRELEEAEIPGTVIGRPKHYYSIYKKMRDQDIQFEDVYDLSGVRIITDSLKNCYALLGMMHALWKPIPGKFKDYIAMPKPNMYQSLHTSVVDSEGQRLEIQIRTEEMHRVAEDGIAAHWHYKEEGKSGTKKLQKSLPWVGKLLESQKEIKNPKEFLNTFKVDLFPQEVYVFTPEGEVVALPVGASPVDFAYQVHTDIGSHCLASKVNGKIVPLRYKLKNGDHVSILTSKQKTPSRDWLSFVKTSKARNKISGFLNKAEREKSLRLGRELLEKEIKKLGSKPAAVFKAPAIEEVVSTCGCNSLDALFLGIGYGKISAHHVAEKLLPKEALEKLKQSEDVRVKVKQKTPPPARGTAIKVKNFDDEILIRMGKCCNPVPGDEIVGYITRGRGVSVHHVDCKSVVGLATEAERRVEVVWDQIEKLRYSCQISIVTEDRAGLLASISGVLANNDVNISRANVHQGGNNRAYFDLDIDIQNLDHLQRTFEKIRQVEGVIHVERVWESQKKGQKPRTPSPSAKNAGSIEDQKTALH